MYNKETIDAFLADVSDEVVAQEEKWGVQTHPTGCGTLEYKELEKRFRDIVEMNSRRSMVTYADILLEEVYKALAAATPKKVYEELIQVSAVAASFARRVKELGLD